MPIVISHFLVTPTAENEENENSNNSEAAVTNVIDTDVTTNVLDNIIAYVDRFDEHINTFDSIWNNSTFEKAKMSRIDIYYTFFFTKEIASSQVIKGDSNWLFYDSHKDQDADTIGDYEGTSTYTVSEMENILEQTLLTQNELLSRNVQFAILIAPNKENIYSEYMPDTYIHSDVSRTDILIDYLAENGVNIINPKQELLENHSDFQIYYSYDTHWNQLGAYIGVKNVLKSWNITKPKLAERSIISYNLAGNYHEFAQDDLANMVGMRKILYNDEIEYEVEDTQIMDWADYEEQSQNNNVQYFYNPDAEIDAKLLIIGDSFRVSMIPSLSETFSGVYVTARTYSSVELLDEIEPDYLISEYVERYSWKLNEISSLIK